MQVVYSYDLFIFIYSFILFFSSRRRHTRWPRDWSSDVCSSDLLAEANAAAITWCAEVNRALHSEIHAVPAARLELERRALRPLPSLRPPLRAGELRTVDRLSTIRFGSARYSVPAALVGKKVEVAALDGEIVVTYAGAETARHLAVAPGEASILDAHYGGARVRPLRAVRAKSAAERAFLALGPAAEAFLRAAAAAGTARLASELAE